MGNELGGFSTSLGLFASPPMILSAKSLVVMEWKGMSRSIATWGRRTPLAGGGMKLPTSREPP